MQGRELSYDSYLPLIQFESIDDFVAEDRAMSAEFYISRIGSSVVLPVRWINRGSSQTVVVFGGAVSTSARSVPLFSGMGVGHKLPSNMLLISDPSLQMDRRLTLGWYAGNLEWPDLQRDVQRVIEHLSADTRLILFGGSGGGFAALDQGPRLPGSIVVASNPQTDILKYHKSPVSRYLEYAWGKETSFRKGTRHEVVSTFSEPVACSVIFFQNLRDRFHYANHFLPFKNNCSSENRVLGVTSEVGAGHKGLDARDVAEFLNLVVSAENWSGVVSILNRFFEAPAVEWNT